MSTSPTPHSHPADDDDVEAPKTPNQSYAAASKFQSKNHHQSSPSLVDLSSPPQLLQHCEQQQQTPTMRNVTNNNNNNKHRSIVGTNAEKLGVSSDECGVLRQSSSLLLPRPLEHGDNLAVKNCMNATHHGSVGHMDMQTLVNAYSNNMKNNNNNNSVLVCLYVLLQRISSIKTLKFVEKRIPV